MTSGVKKKRVLLWHWGRRGGGARYTHELARALSERGEVDVYLSLSRQCEILAEFGPLGLQGHHIDTYTDVPSAILALLRLPMVRARFWRYVREEKIDVVICTMSHIWNVPVLFGRPSRVPYVLVLHDVESHVGDDKPLRQGLLDREVKMADRLVTLTGHTKSLVVSRNGYREDHVSVIPHGVFPYAGGAEKTERDEKGRLRILFFGRLLPYKGLDLLLDAYRQLKDSGKPVVLQIVGPGSLDPYRAGLEGLKDVYADIRWIPEEEIGPIFQNTDIVALPYREASQSGVIATAYAGGLPVVTTPVGGLVEQVADGESGLVASDVTAEALADAIARLVDDDALRERCAKGARKQATEVLAWSGIAHRFMPLINSVLSESGKGNG